MEWASEDNPFEWAADGAAAAALAAAVAFAVGAAGLEAGAAIFAGTAAAVVTFAGLRNVSAGPRTYALPAFEPAPIELAPSEPAEVPAETAELLLEDLLRRVNGDSRVVRLFDPRQMPAAGEDSRRSAHPDASQALSEALAQLRRSLR